MEKKPNRQTVLEYTMRFKTMNSHSIAERINSDVNASVTYKTDLAQYGKPEHWCLPYKWDKALDEVDGKWYVLSF